MSSAIKIANAPCSWGVLEFEQFSPLKSGEEVLSEIRQAGYEGTELGEWGFLPTSPTALRELLAHHHLELVGAFVPLSLRERDKWALGHEQGIKVAKLLSEAGYSQALIVLADDNGKDAHRTMNAGRISGQHLSPDEWQELTRGITQFATAIYDRSGLKTVFHHHCAGFIETPGEVEKLLSGTRADAIGLCLDTGHYSYAGGFAEAACALFGDRIWHVHFKDCLPQIAQKSREKQLDYFQALQEGLFCELGKGMVDFEAVVSALRTHHYEGWIVVEQDVLPQLGSPLACATKNRAYLKAIGL